MTFENLLFEREGATATLTINRPSVLNALNTATLDELRRALIEIRADAAIRAVIVTGAGSKAFVAGADIRELARLGPQDAEGYARSGQRVFAQMEELGKPVVAAVNGFALGGGCELALACTLRIAAETARFGQLEINLGLIPGWGGTQRLPRLVGQGHALELLLTGKQVGAAEAYRIGLVNRVVPGDRLLDEARTLAADLAGKPPAAVKYILDAVHHGLEVPLDAAQRLEASLFGMAASTQDARKGTTAFLEKRKPEFTGR